MVAFLQNSFYILSIVILPSITSDLNTRQCSTIENSLSGQWSNFIQTSYTYHDTIIPSDIIYCSCVNDVITSINYFRSNNIEFTIRSGGHSFGGYSKSNNKTILDVSDLNQITSSNSNSYIYAGPGVTSYQLLTYMNNNDMMLPLGSCASITLGGYVQGGGASITSRNLGLIIDYLVGVYIVLANGNYVYADANNDYSDLFYAIKGGGGGNWGVITEYIFDAKRDVSAPVYYGTVTYFWHGSIQYMSDFLLGINYLLNEEEIGFEASIEYTIQYEVPEWLMIIKLIYIPKTINDSISKGEDIELQFRNIVQANGITPYDEYSDITRSIGEVYDQYIYGWARGDCERTYGISTSRYILNNNQFDSDIINKISTQL